MKNKLFITFIIFLMTSAIANAYYTFDEDVTADYTGEAFFTPPAEYKPPKQEDTQQQKKETTPPVKLLRLKVLEVMQEKRQARQAPVAQSVNEGETSTSKYASKEPEEKFDENITPPEAEINEETVAEAEKSETENSDKGFFKKHKKKKTTSDKNTEDIILDCDNVDYDTPNYLINAKGNVVVTFVKQKTIVKADTMTFDRISNTIKAEGHVLIIKGDQRVTGEYIFIDMNEENGLIECPVTTYQKIEMRAKKGYIYGDKIVQENGTIEVNQSLPVLYEHKGTGPRLSRMLIPAKDKITTDMSLGRVKVETDTIKITQNGDLETLAFKKFKMKKGKYTILKVPAVKMYTNKNHEFIESNIWEVGSNRGMGFYTGPGWVFELPKGSTFKLMPILAYKNKIGIGAYGRFQSGTNYTHISYNTAANKIIGRGKQKLDDHLYLQYGRYDYLNEWWLGSRRAKYGVDLVYQDSYSSSNFLLKNHRSSYSHRIEAGYYSDMDYDQNFEKVRGNKVSTPRFRYMARADQNLFSYKNPEKLTALDFGVTTQLSAALYGTGDTQIIGRVGPTLHTQYRRWMQDIAFLLSAYEDNTPMPVFDAYRYGSQSLYFREYFRLNKYLTVSWFALMDLKRDAPGHDFLRENTFYISVGPDDMKFSVGYDFDRQALRCAVDMALDAKGTSVDFKTFELKQAKKASEDKTPEPETAYQSPTGQGVKVLQKAVVQNVKTMEDVL